MVVERDDGEVVPNVEKGDILTICCSGVVSYYRVLDPETLLCDLITSRTGAATGHRYNLEFASFGFLDETETATIHEWNRIPTYYEAVAVFEKEWEKKRCRQSAT